MRAMSEAEACLIVFGARYFASIGAFSFAEMLGVRAPGSFQADARDTWYTARDLAEPDHEHVWSSDPTERAVCARCGQRADYEQ